MMAAADMSIKRVIVNILSILKDLMKNMNVMGRKMESVLNCFVLPQRALKLCFLFCLFLKKDIFLSVLHFATVSLDAHV